MKSVLGLGGIRFWGRERDPLLEQTLSFVQGFAGSKPAEPVKASEPPEAIQPVRIYSDFMLSERADFERRVREFRARQQTIRQGREQFYNSVAQKTRAMLGNAFEGSAL